MMFRAKLLKPHRWLGLAFAALLFVQGCTGVVVAFRDELNHALHSEALTVAPRTATRTIQDMAEEVRALHPQLGIERIEYPQQDDEALIFRMQTTDGGDLRYIAIDPYSGVVTRDEPVVRWPVQWIYKLHQELLTGAIGHNIVGIVAVTLLFFVVTGLWMWWPGRRNLRRGLTLSFKHGPQRSVRDLHRVGGALAAVVLFFTSCTGIVLIWSAPIRTALSTVATVTVRPTPKVAERSDALLPIDTVVARAREQSGNAPIKSVRFPGLHGRVVSVYFVDVGNSRPRATDQIVFDGYSGETLGTYDASTAAPVSRALDWALPIHTGEWLGLPGRILFLLAAVALQALAITGLLQWWQRRQRRRSVTGR
jgi:uncharacterized iron-regulated membrane protein